MRCQLCSIVFITLTIPVLGQSQEIDVERDILVTFTDAGTRTSAAGIGAPYRNRKRYKIAIETRRHAQAVAREYILTEIDHWPIKSLSVYCFVYRVPENADRERIIEHLQADGRVESVQELNKFETGISAPDQYDDAYVNLQHGLDILKVSDAHQYSRGLGVRIAVVDSNADTKHEDLKGRVNRIAVFTGGSKTADARHGTAVASVIAANSNNAVGIVGVAPEASIELFVACWSEGTDSNAICNSFTLAKAFDALFDDPPDVLNLSLTGPQDSLLARLLTKLHGLGVIVVAARPGDRQGENRFPASMQQVIAVGSSSRVAAGALLASGTPDRRQAIYAPGEQILVAVPDNKYDFRSGSSLAAAHVSGVIALLLAVSPDTSSSAAQSILFQSQYAHGIGTMSVNACQVLHLVDDTLACGG